MRILSIPTALVGLATLASPLLVAAGEADVCYGPSANAMAAPKLTAEMRFSCPSAGIASIPQLAADGWRVAHLSLVAASPTGGTLGGSSTSIEAAWLLVIERH